MAYNSTICAVKTKKKSLEGKKWELYIVEYIFSENYIQFLKGVKLLEYKMHKLSRQVKIFVFKNFKDMKVINTCAVLSHFTAASNLVKKWLWFWLSESLAALLFVMYLHKYARLPCNWYTLWTFTTAFSVLKLNCVSF